MSKIDFNQGSKTKPLDIILIVILIFTIGFGIYSKLQINSTQNKVDNIQSKLDSLRLSLDPDQIQAVKLQTKKAFYDQKTNSRIYFTNFLSRILQINNNQKGNVIKSISFSGSNNFSSNFQTPSQSLNPLLDATIIIKSFADSSNFLKTFTPSINIGKNVFDKIQTQFSIQGEYQPDTSEELFIFSDPKAQESQSKIKDIQEKLKAKQS